MQSMGNSSTVMEYFGNLGIAFLIAEKLQVIAQ
jgi:hypothetical protein